VKRSEIRVGFFQRKFTRGRGRQYLIRGERELGQVEVGGVQGSSEGSSTSGGRGENSSEKILEADGALK